MSEERVTCDSCGYVMLVGNASAQFLLAGRCAWCVGWLGLPKPVEGQMDEANTFEQGHPEFLKLLDEMRAVHLKKSADYGTKGQDPLANLRATEAFGIPAWVGAVIRCNDKMKRVQSFVKNGELKNESVEDSLLDGAAYFLLALVLYREQKGGG